MVKREYLVRLKIKDERGNVVDEIDAVSFKGLLALAHEHGLVRVHTTPLVMPTKDNGERAVVLARIRIARGTFTGIGDADPGNVNRRIAPHVLRMAETRALARAFRLAVNIGEVAVEELVDVETAPVTDGRDREPERSNGNGDHRRHVDRFEQSFRGRDRAPTEAQPGDKRAMSAEQRKLCFRLAYDLVPKEVALERVLAALGVARLEHATRADAARAIDSLKEEIAARGARDGSRGNGAAAGNGASHD